MNTLTEQDRRFFTGTNFGHLATLLPDGAPHSVVVWIDEQDGLVLINTAQQSVKVRNIQRDPRVAVSVHDQEEPYRMVSVQGRVTDPSCPCPPSRRSAPSCAVSRWAPSTSSWRSNAACLTATSWLCSAACASWVSTACSPPAAEVSGSWWWP
jgi:PPOX class probable F420-dependent enzyme